MPKDIYIEVKSHLFWTFDGKLQICGQKRILFFPQIVSNVEEMQKTFYVTKSVTNFKILRYELLFEVVESLKFHHLHLNYAYLNY